MRSRLSPQDEEFRSSHSGVQGTGGVIVAHASSLPDQGSFPHRHRGQSCLHCQAVMMLVQPSSDSNITTLILLPLKGICLHQRLH